jgi:cytochrome c-type biogenesis protein CcmF
MAFLLDSGHWTGPVGTGLAFFAGTALMTDYLRAIRQRRAQLSEPWLRAARKTVLGNRRHYGGMVVHFGIVVVALGLVGSGLFKSETSVVMAPGDVVELQGEQLKFEGVRTVQGPNYRAVEARIRLLKAGRTVTPQRRTYLRQQAPMTETSIDSTPLRDVYVVLGDAVDDRRWAVRAYVNPLVQFIWIGGAIMLSGLGLTLSGRRRAARVKETVSAAATATK